MVAQFQQAAAQRQQVAGEVSAVYRGDVLGQQRLQSLCVIPVQKMPVIAFEMVHRTHRVRGPVEELAGSDVAEVIRAEIREQ